ncbi:MAG: GntR family transcriptional regulator [Phycisphaerales bacterium JB063]
MTLSDRIQRELIVLLADAEPLPFKLTLTAISKHFGVSPMPVRRAVADLISQGVLRKQGNGRLEVDPVVVATLEQTEWPGEDDAASIEQRITDAVVTRSLTRDEHYLREAEAAQEFGVGRTVVRRVFGQLAGQGLLTRVPRCGWLVRPYREKDMLDYLDIRETLEVKALRLARDRLDPAVLQTCLDGNDPGGRNRSVQLDNRLHAYWIEQSHNRYIIDFFAHHGTFYSALFDYAALEPGATRAMARQHREILEALLAGDLRTACKALTRHIRAQQSNTAKMIDHLAHREP